MKKGCLAVLLAVLVLGVTACGEKEHTDETQQAQEAAGEEQAEEEEVSATKQVTYADLKSTVTSLGEYKGISVERTEEEVTDEMVENEVWGVKKELASLQDIEREAQIRDVVIIDYTGYVDGKTQDSLQGSAYELELGSGAFVPGFEEQLLGVKNGEDREVVLTFPEDYYEDMAGKEARFEVHVQKVQEYVLPEDWKEALLEMGYENEEDISVKARKELEKVAEEDADANMEYDLLMKVIEGSTYEIQEADAKAYTDEMMREYQMYAAMYGMDLESYLTQMGKTEEEVRKMYQDTAEFRVKLILTLHEIAKVENIKVTEEECQETLKELAAQYGYEGTEEVEAVYGREMVEDQLIQEKVINLIRSNANY